MSKKNYDVAAYVWPSYSGDDPRSLIFWQEGMGEWQTVRDAQPKFSGHVEPRKPLWGYVNEANPDVMELQINAALRHGVNVFIYDWYWYDNRPFLENCLNDGFLGAKNNMEMQFYLMWANHDATHLWDKRNSGKDGLIWEGIADRTKFETVCNRIIERYFSRPNYYKIDNAPVFSIYDLPNLIRGLGGITQTLRALDWFRQRCVEAGFGGLHLQGILPGGKVPGAPGEKPMSMLDFVAAAGFNSTTHYQFVQMTDINRDYSEVLSDIEKVWQKSAQSAPTYFPHVSLGWDNNARFTQFNDGIIKNNTPQQIEKALHAAKSFVDARQNTPRLITINSWNEWTEGSYLQPDTQYGYGYLEAIRRVFAAE